MLQPLRDSPPETRHPLTPERIVNAALELMDRDGMASLTMRKLGGHLSVQAMSLYGYFPNKEALLSAVGDTLFAKIQSPAPGVDVFDGLRAVMVSFYQLAEEHPSMVDLLFSGLFGGLRVSALASRGDADLAALRSAGFREDASSALASLTCFVVGALHQGRAVTAGTRWAQFTFGLDVILNGLRMEARRRSAPDNAND